MLSDGRRRGMSSDELPDLGETAIRSVMDKSGLVWLNRDDLLLWLQSGAHMSFALDERAPEAVRRAIENALILGAHEMRKAVTEAITGEPPASPAGVASGGEALTDRLCAEITRHTNAAQHQLDEEPDSALALRPNITGRIHGLRIALCHAIGLDPDREAHEGGAADHYVSRWNASRNSTEEPR
jgi:hypothetical protein